MTVIDQSGLDPYHPIFTFPNLNTLTQSQHFSIDNLMIDFWVRFSSAFVRHGWSGVGWEASVDLLVLLGVRDGEGGLGQLAGEGVRGGGCGRGS